MGNNSDTVDGEERGRGGGKFPVDVVTVVRLVCRVA